MESRSMGANWGDEKNEKRVLCITIQIKGSSILK